MSVDRDLIEQSIPLKERLLDYATSRRFQKDLRRYLEHQFDTDDPPDDPMELIDMVDAFMLEYPLRDGRTVVEHFVASQPDLTQAERDLLLGWLDVVEGVFQVDQLLGDALIVHNLVDDLTYIAYSNLGPGGIPDLEPQSYLLMRLIPAGSVWMISGTVRTLPPEEREAAERTASALMVLRPAAVFRNTDKLDRAWELQRQQRTAFIENYGSDLLVVDNNDLARIMEEFSVYLRLGVFDLAGTPFADDATDESDDPEQAAMRLAEFFGEIYGDGSAAIFFDERAGLRSYRDFGLVDAAFADPTLASQRQYREAISSYVRDPGIHPAILHRLVERHPDTADDALRRALNRTGFSWEKDSERLLRRYKAELLDHEPMPMVMTLYDARAVDAGIVPDWFSLNRPDMDDYEPSGVPGA